MLARTKTTSVRLTIFVMTKRENDEEEDNEFNVAIVGGFAGYRARIT